MQEHPFIESIIALLAKNASERQFLEDALAKARGFYGGQQGSPQHSLPLESTTPVSNGAMNGSRFGAQPGGPKDTILKILSARPGMSRSELRQLAISAVVSSAKDRSRSIDETMRVLIKNGAIIQRDGGLHVPRSVSG